jgi:CheY-like chemotaxis protein
MLGKLGCDVTVAAHGAEALDQLEHKEFDLVLMDCNMPVMDGYEASRQIRRSGRWPHPIVALTANAMSEERERCRAAGMSDYLAKPFRREELAALLDVDPLRQSLDLPQQMIETVAQLFSHPDPHRCRKAGEPSVARPDRATPDRLATGSDALHAHPAPSAGAAQAATAPGA